MTDIDLVKLKELALAATRGGWKWFTSNSHKRLSSIASGKDGDVISAFRATDGVPCVNVSQPNMEFIEALNPDVVFALIEQLEAAQRERDLLTAQLSVAAERAALNYDRATAAETELKRRDVKTKQTGELTMWIKRLSHSLRNIKPDSKLHNDAMDYLSRNGLISVVDCLRDAAPAAVPEKVVKLPVPIGAFVHTSSVKKSLEAAGVKWVEGE